MDKKDVRRYLTERKAIVAQTAEDGFNSVGRGAVLVDRCE